MCESETYDEWCRRNSEEASAKKAARAAAALASAIPPLTRSGAAPTPRAMGFISARVDEPKRLASLSCHYCGRPLAVHGRTKDHVVPRSRGGRATVDACPRCNSWKGNLSLEEFRFLLAFRMGRVSGVKDEFSFWFESPAVWGKGNLGSEVKDLP